MACWIPLESNPDVMNKFLHKVGVPAKYEVIDVYGLSEDLLAVVPQPVFALILLSPWSEQYQQFTKDEDAELKEKGQTVSDNVFFMKQFVRNACGTIALIHSVANNTDQIELEDGALKNFLEETKDLDPQERGKRLSSADGIEAAHKEVAVEGQTQPPPGEENADFAFIAFIHKDGHIYLLDGAREFPVNQGPTTAETFLVDAAKVCKQFIAREGGDMRFNILALTHALA